MDNLNGISWEVFQEEIDNGNIFLVDNIGLNCKSNCFSCPWADDKCIVGPPIFFAQVLDKYPEWEL